MSEGRDITAEVKRIITEHLPHLLNPFDAIAVEEALRIREEHDLETEILAVTIGPHRVPG